MKLISSSEAIVLIAKWKNYSLTRKEGSEYFCSVKKDWEEFDIYF